MSASMLLFDLDGTITDSRRGIVRCIGYALEQLGRAAPADDDLTRYVGPPLAASFEVLLSTSDAALVERAIAAYRDRYDRLGLFENEVFPGVTELLTLLASAGCHLRIVTAKPRAYAIRVLEHLGLQALFGGVHGPDLGARQYTKTFLIEEALAIDAPRDEALMIGDKPDDVQAAREAGIRSVAVTWGYGTREELAAAAPDAFVDTPAALVEFLRPALLA